MKIRKVEAKIEQVEERAANLSEKALPCLCAYVTVESQKGRAFLLKKYSQNALMRLCQSHAMRFRCAALLRAEPLRLPLLRFV